MNERRLHITIVISFFRVTSYIVARLKEITGIEINRCTKEKITDLCKGAKIGYNFTQ